MPVTFPFVRSNLPATLLIALTATLAAPGTAQTLPAPAGVHASDNSYGFPVWFSDYPVELELPTAALAQTYERSRRQALERVAANLQGNTRREVWLMATEFFGHAPDDAVDVLIGAMDRALGLATVSMQDVLLNTIEAMAHMGRQEFEEPLRRALEHPNDSVRQAAYGALGTSGSAETLRALYPAFLKNMNGRSRAAWLRGARQRLGHEAVPMLQGAMVSSTPAVIRDLILKEAVKFEPADAADIVTGLWEDAVGDFKAILAGILHGAGRANGSGWLHTALIDANPRLVALALANLRGREFGILRDDVLRCSTHDSPDVRLELAKTLAGRSGDDVLKVFEVLAGATELIETKCLAVRELVRHGSGSFLGTLIEDAKTATGTQLEMILRLLAASGDPRVVPVFVDRFLGAPAQEGRSFLQALSTSQAKGAAAALLALFRADSRAVNQPDGGQVLTTVSYLPVLLLNVHGEEDVVLDAWKTLPATDHVRRALLLNTLCGFAADREDPALRERIWNLVRTVLFDQEAIPQLRIQALNALARRAIGLDDVMRMRRRQSGDGEGEASAMRAVFKDYLCEYF